NFGASWQRIHNGLPDNCPVRVLREDPNDKNVLFLGTEWGMYLSLDAGNSWQNFQQNLPVSPITDIVVHRDDLVVSTMGRSFWILDDISSLRGLSRADLSEATLLPPRPAVRTRLSGAGAHLHYVLAADSDALQIEIRDLSTPEPQLVRTIKANQRDQDQGGRNGGRDQGMRAPFTRGRSRGGLDASKGLHRYTWDMRSEGVNGRGPLVAAGTYEVRLVHEHGASTQNLTLTMDPRLAAEGITAEDLQAQAELILAVQELSQRTDKLVAELRRLSRAQMSEERGAKLDAIRARLVNASGAYPQQMLQSQVRYLSSMIDRADQRPGGDAYVRLKQLEQEIGACEDDLNALK